MKKGNNVVIDTDVIVSALRSNAGVSFILLSLIDSGKFKINISVPLNLKANILSHIIKKILKVAISLVLKY